LYDFVFLQVENKDVIGFAKLFRKVLDWHLITFVFWLT